MHLKHMCNKYYKLCYKCKDIWIHILSIVTPHSWNVISSGLCSALQPRNSKYYFAGNKRTLVYSQSCSLSYDVFLIVCVGQKRTCFIDNSLIGSPCLSVCYLHTNTSPVGVGIDVSIVLTSSLLCDWIHKSEFMAQTEDV